MRIEGTAIYMNRNQQLTPYALVHTAEHFKCVHKNIIFMTVIYQQKPYLSDENRFSVHSIFENGYQIIINYGYLEQPDIPKVLNQLKLENSIFDPQKVSFIVGRENVFATDKPGMALWRENIFSLQTKNEMPATQYFQLPKDRVGDGATVKRFFHKKNSQIHPTEKLIELRPANPSLTSMWYQPQQVSVKGLVKALLRKYN